MGKMKLRLFDLDKDFNIVTTWISDERTHMLWSANRIPFPLSKASFKEFLQDIASSNGDIPYVAVDDDGKPIGFYVYSFNEDTKEGMLKFVVVDSKMRGKGIAKEMLKLAVSAAFEDETVEAVHLNVFSANDPARRCYEKTGFVERSVTSDAFSYGDESWDRINMVIKR